MKTVLQVLAEATIPHDRAVQALRELFRAGFIGWDGQAWVLLPEPALRRAQWASRPPIGSREEPSYRCPTCLRRFFTDPRDLASAGDDRCWWCRCGLSQSADDIPQQEAA